MTQQRTYFRFEHPEDITIGVGRVIYCGIENIKMWVLPGGIRTYDRKHAEDVARRIDEITRKQAAKHGAKQ